MRFETDELTALGAAIKQAERDGRPDQIDALRRLMTKVRVARLPAEASRAEPDLHVLMAAEGLAMRAGPRARVAAEKVAQLRHAILACRRVQMRYRLRDGTSTTRVLEPYGFLQGIRHYLVAINVEAGAYRLYRLDAIEEIELLPDSFEHDPAFDLEAFAARSFGVYQEDPVDVVWRFVPEVVREARGFVFHPSQQLEDLPDGSLRVRFRAGGLLEMAWHLFCWGDFVTVESPAELRTLMAKEIDRIRAALAPRARGGGGAPDPGQRTPLKQVRSSSTKSSGCSKAAKWPPRSSSFQ